MRRTSIEVYRRIRDEGLLSSARLAVYGVLFDHGPLTGSEVNAALRSKSAHKRLSELLEQGVIVDVGLKVCRQTGERVTSWDVTDALPAGLSRPTGTPRPSAVDVRLTLDAMRERARERPFGPEVTRVMRWLRERFREEHAQDPAKVDVASRATNELGIMSLPGFGEEGH